MVNRVWGKADTFELVFSQSGSTWQAAVPKDLEDGQYVVELYCSDDAGSVAYWTGILYLNNSDAVSIRIVADKFKLWLVSDIEVKLQGDINLSMEDDRITLQVICADYIGRG